MKILMVSNHVVYTLYWTGRVIFSTIVKSRNVMDSVIIVQSMRKKTGNHLMFHNLVNKSSKMDLNVCSSGRG